MRYDAQFIGRQRSAIGVFYPIKTTVEGVDMDDARLNLYDRFEHIQALRLEALPDGVDRVCRNCGQYVRQGRCLNDCQSRRMEPTE